MALVKVSSMPANCAFLSISFRISSVRSILSNLNARNAFLFQMNILIIQRRNTHERGKQQQHWMNYSRLRQATSWGIDDRREWWASISENNAYTLSEWRRAQPTNENIKNTSILKRNAFKTRKQISFILDIFHHCPVVIVVLCKLFFLVNCVCASALFFSPLISLLKTINTFWRTEEEEEKNCLWRFCRFSSFTPLFWMHLFVYTLSLVRGLRARGCEHSHTFSLIRSRFHTYINTHEEKEKKATHNTTLCESINKNRFSCNNWHIINA